MSNYQFKNGVFFVKGARRSAILDTNSEKRLFNECKGYCNYHWTSSR